MVYIKYICDNCYGFIDIGNFDIKSNILKCHKCNNNNKIKNKFNTYDYDESKLQNHGNKYNLVNDSAVTIEITCKTENCNYNAWLNCYGYCLNCVYLKHGIIFENELKNNRYYSTIVNFKKYIYSNYNHYMNNLECGLYYLYNNYKHATKTISFFKSMYKFTFDKIIFYIVFQSDITIINLKKDDKIFPSVDKKYCSYILCFDAYRYGFSFNKLILLISKYIYNKHKSKIGKLNTIIDLL